MVLSFAPCNKTKHNKTQRGAIFGEGSMIFHRRRSATVRAKGKMRAWVVDDE